MKRAYYVLSDLHMGPGRLFDSERTKKPYRLEDFVSDNELIAFLDHVVEITEANVPITFIANGDVLEFVAMPVRKRLLGFSWWGYGIEPTPEGALTKLELCVKGHPKVFEAFRKFLRARVGNEINFVPGNHDVDLRHPEVQERLCSLLASEGEESRVRFDEEERIGKTVHRMHGDRFDPLNANPPAAEPYVTDKYAVAPPLVAAVIFALTYGAVLPVVFLRRAWTLESVGLSLISIVAGFFLFGWIFGKVYFRFWGQAKKFQRQQYANFLHAELVTRIKQSLPEIGRLEDHGDLWLQTAMREPHLAPVLLPVVVAHVGYQMFLNPRPSVQNDATFKTVWNLLVSTTRADQYEEHVKDFARRNPDVTDIVAGHTHGLVNHMFDVDGRMVGYWNGGSGVEQARFTPPPIVCRTRWRRIEWFMRSIVYHWQHAPREALRFMMMYASIPLAVMFFDAVVGRKAGTFEAVLLIIAFAITLLGWSRAEYQKETFSRLTPIGMFEEDDGTVLIRLFEYFAPSQPEGAGTSTGVLKVLAPAQ